MRHRQVIEVIAGGEVDALVTTSAREKILAAVREAHRAGRIDMEEFVALTDGALALVHVEEADRLLGRIGCRMSRTERRSLPERVARRGAPPLGAGALALGVVMAAPAALGVPAGPWVGLGMWSGAVVAVLVGVLELAWAAFPGISWRARRGPRDGGTPARAHR